MLYKMLHNRHYLGEISHKNNWYPGEHPPILERSVWDAAHAILATNRHSRSAANRSSKTQFLLKGLVFGADGRALTTNFARNRFGRTYRYYISTRETREYAGASDLPRLPANELESAVMTQLRGLMRAPEMLGDITQRAVELDAELDEAQVTCAMTRLDEIWDQLFPAEQQRIVRLLVERIVVAPDGLEVRLRPAGLESLARELSPEREEIAA